MLQGAGLASIGNDPASAVFVPLWTEQPQILAMRHPSLIQEGD